MGAGPQSVVYRKHCVGRPTQCSILHYNTCSGFLCITV